MTLVTYARNLETLYETPREIPVEFAIDRRRTRERFRATSGGARGPLRGGLKALLEAYGIPRRPAPAATPRRPWGLAEAIGYPVVLKILSPDITHKTDVGGVVLDLRDEAMVRAAFERIVAAAAKARPDAEHRGRHRAADDPEQDGVELILGVKQDPVFGTVIMAGMGGPPPNSSATARWASRPSTSGSRAGCSSRSALAAAPGLSGPPAG